MESDDATMTSSRPYLLRAIYEWLIANDKTPYLLVNANYDDVIVPLEYVNDGKIILNIGLNASRHLELGDESVSFEARFSGKPMSVYVPMPAVLALYAKENGKGMVFSIENEPSEPPPSKKEDKKPHLKIVK